MSESRSFVWFRKQKSFLTRIDSTSGPQGIIKPKVPSQDQKDLGWYKNHMGQPC